MNNFSVSVDKFEEVVLKKCLGFKINKQIPFFGFNNLTGGIDLLTVKSPEEIRSKDKNRFWRINI